MSSHKTSGYLKVGPPAWDQPMGDMLPLHLSDLHFGKGQLGRGDWESQGFPDFPDFFMLIRPILGGSRGGKHYKTVANCVASE